MAGISCPRSTVSAALEAGSVPVPESGIETAATFRWELTISSNGW